MSAKPEEKAKVEGEAPKKGKGKLIIIIVAAVLLLGGGGGAAYYFLKPKPVAHDDEEDPKEVKAPPKKSPDKIFSPLDPFTVNLADEGGERMAQIAVVLEFDTKDWADKLPKHMPIVRNRILMLISSQKSKDILSLQGKNRLARSIAEESGLALGWELPDEEDDEDPELEEEAKDADKESAKEAAKKPVKKKKKKRKARRAEPNPVVAVHFGQFIVQ